METIKNGKHVFLKYEDLTCMATLFLLYFPEVYKVPLGNGAPPASQSPVSKKRPAFVEEPIQSTNNETVESAPPPAVDEGRFPPRSISPENVRPPFEENIQRTTEEPTSVAPDETDNKGSKCKLRILRNY